jgi:hypothetical protein
MTVVKIVPMPGAAVEGPRGLAGPAGPQGIQGNQGIQGIQGEPGESITPNTGTWTPLVSGTGFSQSSNTATGNYNRVVDLVFVNMNVPFSNVTSFGTGQYSVTLPFDSMRHTDVIGGSLHDTSTGRYYTIKGHLENGSNVMSLWYISGTGLDDPLDYNSPFLADTTDLFHMSFVYEAEPVD